MTTYIFTYHYHSGGSRRLLLSTEVQFLQAERRLAEAEKRFASAERRITEAEERFNQAEIEISAFTTKNEVDNRGGLSKSKGGVDDNYPPACNTLVKTPSSAFRWRKDAIDRIERRIKMMEHKLNAIEQNFALVEKRLDTT